MHKLKGPIAGALVILVSVGTALAGGGFDSLPAIGTASHLTPTAVKPDAVAPDSFSATERRSIEDVVRAELRAIVAQDATGAFAKLTPSTQSFFGGPEKFLRAVADELPPILVTKQFSFLGIDRSGSTTSEVLITDVLGQEWLAEFQMERQKNGDWRVKGCVVEAAPGQRA
jgi:Domain of unknown function (DUF4864)